MPLEQDQNNDQNRASLYNEDRYNRDPFYASLVNNEAIAKQRVLQLNLNRKYKTAIEKENAEQIIAQFNVGWTVNRIATKLALTREFVRSVITEYINSPIVEMLRDYSINEAEYKEAEDRAYEIAQKIYKPEIDDPKADSIADSEAEFKADIEKQIDANLDSYQEAKAGEIKWHHKGN